jgi:hypothetical protein
MLAHTARDKGEYKGDIVIFTTSPFYSDYANIVNISEHPDKQLLKTEKKGGYFHQHLLPELNPQLKEHKEIYDYFLIKALPGEFIKKEKYDFILYLDSDMLVTNNINDIFTRTTLTSDHHNHTVLDEFRRVPLLLNKEETEKARLLNAAGGGAIGVPINMYSFYSEFKTNYLRFLNSTQHDMPALAYTVLTHPEYKHVNLPRHKYWDHFWGGMANKVRMCERYKKWYGKHPLQHVENKGELNAAF